MSTRGVPFHILPSHASASNRPALPESGGITSSRRYAYNGSANAVNKFVSPHRGKNICDTILIASRAGAAPTDTNPYAMSL